MYLKTIMLKTNKQARSLIDQKAPLSILESFYYADEVTEQVIPLIERFMLDSGAFTFMSSGKHPSIDSYIERYIDFINQNDVHLFFEMDIDGLIGYEKVKQIRKRLERETGKQPIPVWHKRLGIDEFKRMADEYPYVAIGGIVSKEIKPNDYRHFPWFIKEAHKRKAKIHGLGFTNLEGIRKYHFDSVDSTAWTTGNRFGAVYSFNGKTMVKKGREENQRISDSRALAVHNFNEWVKFQQYAKDHL